MPYGLLLWDIATDVETVIILPEAIRGIYVHDLETQISLWDVLIRRMY